MVVFEEETVLMFIFFHFRKIVAYYSERSEFRSEIQRGTDIEVELPGSRKNSWNISLLRIIYLKSAFKQIRSRLNIRSC